MASPRSRNWCWTIFPSESYEISEATVLDLAAGGCRYAIWQLERCPTTSRLHFQGYSEFNSALRPGGVKLFLGHNHAHVEVRRGPRAAAINYCRKDDTRVAGPWELGSSVITPGARSDLSELAGEISAGKSLSSIRRDDPVQYVKYRNGIKDLVFHASKERAKVFRELEVLVYYGDAGTGKTRSATQDFGDYYILDQGDRLWFDGYEGEETLIIDDFYGWVKYGVLLRLLDGHQYRCEIKGGFTYALWKRVVITSNKHPSEWFAVGLTPALERRITTIRHFEL